MQRLSVFLGALAAFVMGGCDAAAPPDSELRWGLTEEQLAEGPSYHRMKGAILNDVRVWRELDKHLDKGKPDCPEVAQGEAGAATCAAGHGELQFFDLRSDSEDEPYRVEEAAYYCPVEGLYYYHYTGGGRHLDVWLGPFHLDRSRR